MEQKVVSTAVRPRQIEFSSRVSWKSEHLSQNFIHICQRHFRWLNVVGCSYNVLKGFCCTVTLWETLGWVACLPTSFNGYCIDSVCLYVESFFSLPRLQLSLHVVWLLFWVKIRFFMIVSEVIHICVLITLMIMWQKAKR